MKFLRQSLLLILAALPLFLLADDVTPKPPPDFSPPKETTGPVFPPEEILKPPSKETNQFITEFITTIATLGLIISAILIFGWFLKRFINTKIEQANDTSGIRIAERRMISTKTGVYLLEVEGRGVLIAETPTGVTRLMDFPLASNEAPPEAPSSFSKLLDKGK